MSNLATAYRSGIQDEKQLIHRNPNSFPPRDAVGIVKFLNRMRFKCRECGTRNENVRNFRRSVERPVCSVVLLFRCSEIRARWEAKIWNRKIWSGAAMRCAASERLPNVYLMRYIRFAESRPGKVFYFNRSDRCTLGVGVPLYCDASCLEWRSSFPQFF